MGVCGAFFGRRGVLGFSGPVLGVSSGVGGFKFLMIAACRGVTGFICPSPVLWTGLACVPKGVPGTAARSSRPLGALRTDSAWCAGALGRLAPASASVITP